MLKKSAPTRALVLVLGRIVFGRHDESSTLSSSSKDDFDNVNHLLLIVQRPVDLVIVSGALQR